MSPFPLPDGQNITLTSHLSGDAEAMVPRPSQQSVERPSVRIQLAPQMQEDEYWGAKSQIVAHFVVFLPLFASLWWGKYRKDTVLRENSVQKGLFGRIRQLRHYRSIWLWYVREIYIHRDYVTDWFPLRTDWQVFLWLWMICFEVGCWVGLVPILTDSCEMSIRGVSAVIGPAWHQNLLSAASADCNRKDAGTFWICWWITCWRHLKAQPFSTAWWNEIEWFRNWTSGHFLWTWISWEKHDRIFFLHGRSIRQASIQFSRWPEFEERNLTVKINGCIFKISAWVKDETNVIWTCNWFCQMLSNKWNMSVRFGTCSLHEGYRTVSPSWMTMRDIGTRGALGWMSHPNEKSNFETFQCFCGAKILQLDLFFGELMPTSHGSQLGMPLSVTRKDATSNARNSARMISWFHYISFIF